MSLTPGTLAGGGGKGDCLGKGAAAQFVSLCDKVARARFCPGTQPLILLLAKLTLADRQHLHPF